MNSDRMLLKAKAIEFFAQSGIASDIERSLNNLFKEAPKDPRGYISSYFDRLSEPARITRVEAVMITGDGGLAAMKVSVYGSFKNEEVLLSQLYCPNNVLVTPCVPLSLDFINSHNDIITKCVNLINNDLCGLLEGLDPREDEAIHRILRSNGDVKQRKHEEDLKDKTEPDPKKEEVKTKVDSAKKSTLKKGPTVIVLPDDPPEVLCPLLRAHSALSMALAIAAAKMEKKAFSQYTEELTALKDTKEGPTLPMIALLRNGKGLPGKCQLIKRCLVTPNGFYDSADIISADLRLLSYTLNSNLQSKTPLIMITDQGELVPAYDRPEQFLDVLQEVIKECELEDKMRVVVEVCARGIFDMDKGKYEVITGQMKSSEELVAMLTDLVDRYPIIVGLVEPLRTQDKEGWRSLGISLCSHCWLMGRSLRVQKLIKQPSNHLSAGSEDTKVEDDANTAKDEPPIDVSDPVSVSVMCSTVDGHSLYNDYLSYAGNNTGQMICLWLDDLSAEDWLVELGCGLNVAILAFPGLRCPSGATKLNHWVHLLSASLYEKKIGLSFPEIYKTSESLTQEEDSSSAA